MRTTRDQGLSRERVIALVRELTISARSKPNKKKGQLNARRAKNLLLRHHLTIEDVGSEAGDRHKVVLLRQKSMSYLRSLLSTVEIAQAEALQCRVASPAQRKQVEAIVGAFTRLRNTVEFKLRSMNEEP
jgi:hypothetical protein